jgi:hypothetical protein
MRQGVKKERRVVVRGILELIRAGLLMITATILPLGRCKAQLDASPSTLNGPLSSFAADKLVSSLAA